MNAVGRSPLDAPWLKSAEERLECGGRGLVEQGRVLLPPYLIRELLTESEDAAFLRLLDQAVFMRYSVGLFRRANWLDLWEVFHELDKLAPSLPAPAASSGKPAPQPAKPRAKKPKRKEKEAWMVDVPPPPLAADPPGHWSDES